ncbi:MAG: hypothetical protein KDC95_08695 [Planctomycetes bacterium]|nr:hypothetical protein [Planctomycetota bacterium]
MNLELQHDELIEITSSESGFIMIAMVAIVLPLLAIVGSATMSMNSRSSRLTGELRQEKALIAAESGIDECIYRASTAIGLSHGDSFERDLGGGMSFSVKADLLSADGEDNDDDKNIDEADENVFRVLVTGHFESTQRRLVAYLGPRSGTGSMPAALSIQNPSTEITIKSGCLISGNNTNIDGSAGDASQSTYGLTIDTPNTISALSSELSSSEATLVTGIGGTPSLGVSTSPIDLAAKKLEVQNSANIVLTGNEYEGKTFGNAATNDYKIVYRSGNLTLKGGTKGAGILFVTGELHTEGTVRWDGIIYVLGHVEIHDNTQIRGAMVTGPSSEHTTLEGSTKIIYSAEAIAGASSMVAGKFTAFNGWQEISRY